MAKCACGTDLPLDAAFCPSCGRRLTVPTPVPTPAAAALGATLSDIQTITGGGGPTSSVTLAPGDLFHGRYTIERHLGAGAMGVVYAAKDQVTNRTVALKLINPALADRPSARERFLREGLMARDVRHSKIVAMYDVGEVDGQVYLVMEYLTGDTLRKWLHGTLQEGRDLSFDTARAIIRHVLEGLAAAHATGVVHRDLKPENVMLLGDPNQGDFSLKILDFGIARAVGASSHVTTTSSSTGTPLYMAPEQKTAADTVGPAADLYAVTAMLYELLIGVAPEGRWGPPSRERKDLPPGIDTIVETGLASRPRSRYQSAEEYIKALDAVGQVPVPVGPPHVDPPTPVPVPAPASKWWQAVSPAWALWARLTKKQKYLVGAVGLIAVISFAAYSADEYGGGGYVPPGGNTSGGSASGASVAGGSEASTQGAAKDPVNPPPPPPVDMNIVGRWSDEVTGTRYAVGYLDIYQQGSVVTAAIYNTNGIQIGTFAGRVQGIGLSYDYVAINGATGSGHGRMTSDGNHLDIQVRDNLTGHVERHTLHRNHMPH
jgi:tRNA A-37 threonylcarbamoyl transferase component Bud32